MRTYRIEFLKPAYVEGREYHPAFADRRTLLTYSGKARQFRSLENAVKWASECFGRQYKETLRIFEK